MEQKSNGVYPSLASEWKQLWKLVWLSLEFNKTKN